MADALVWPPKKEDLERLYLVERLSAAKIAKVYGLKYKNPKVAESTALYQLKKNGIKRRGCADHLREVKEQMVNVWIARYQAGESLKQIAGDSVSPVTIWNHLRTRGVVLRDRIEAQIQAVTKHERKPFQGDDIEKAYLMGLRYGDLHVVRHGRAIRVRLSTTHPAMADLFESLFSPFAHVLRYPRRAKLVGYEWSLECDLSRSFEFLLTKPSISELRLLNNRMFVAFLAGLFDAEGSVLMHKKGEHYDPEVTISNSDRDLIEFLFVRIRQLGFSAHQQWAKQRMERKGIHGNSVTGRVTIWKFGEVQEFLRVVPLRHREKVAKAKLVQSLSFGRGHETSILEQWKMLKIAIKEERAQFLAAAASAISDREKLGCGARRPEERDLVRFQPERLKTSYLSFSTGQ